MLIESSVNGIKIVNSKTNSPLKRFQSRIEFACSNSMKKKCVDLQIQNGNIFLAPTNRTTWEQCLSASDTSKQLLHKEKEQGLPQIEYELQYQIGKREEEERRQALQ